MKPKPRPKTKPRGLPTGQAGFSLIEVIFSVVFLTVIVLGVVKLQTSNLALSNTQNKTLEAVNLANQSAEIMEAIGRTAIDNAGCMGFPCTRYLRLNGSNFELTQDVANKTVGNFDRTIQINRLGIESGAVTANPAAGVLTNGYQVTAMIEWEDSTGEHKQTTSEGAVNAQVEAKRIIY